MKKLLLLPIFLLLFLVASINFGAPIMVHAANVTIPSTHNMAAKAGGLFPTWYKYLTVDSSNGEITMDKDDLPKNLILIGLAVIEMLLVLAGIIAVIMVMVGGFKYVTSQGESDKIAGAKNTIINALVGAVIAIIASQVVVYIAGMFSATPDAKYGLIPVDANSSNLKIILDIFFAIIGAVSVFMIVLAGFNFIVSGGNAEKVAKARRTIYYALIGLVVAVFATVIVSFVLKGSTK
ncbi:MAG: hypothetical protein WCP03_01900 [Candidatus Saccharibacteria bacterium]